MAPRSRTGLLALHALAVLPLAAVAVWFTVVDTLPPGAQRCGSCGVEARVTAAYAAVAVLGGVTVAGWSAVRRDLRGENARPGPVTLAALAAAAAYGALALEVHDAFDLVALGGLVASLLAVPVGAIAWLVRLAALVRGRPVSARDAATELWLAWIALAVVLPGAFAWTWLARVQWIVF